MGAQRRRAHPLGPLEVAPLVARRTELLLEREVEVLRTGLAEHVLSVVACPRELLDRLLGAHVHHVEGGTGQVREHDGAMGGLLLHLPGAGLAVEEGIGVPRGNELLGQHVDGGTVLGVHHGEHPAVRGHLHRLEDLRVVGVEDARVGHEELEARDPLVDEGRHRGEGVVVDTADDLVEAVVDRAVAGGEVVPAGKTVLDALAVLLHREVDDRGGAAPGGGAGSRLERVRREGSAEGQLHVRVRVDPAGDDVLSGGIDDRVDGTGQVRAEEHRSRREDGDDPLAVDEHVGFAPAGRRDHGPARDECGCHVAVSLCSRSLRERSETNVRERRCLRTYPAGGLGRTASRPASAGPCPCRDRARGVPPRCRSRGRRRSSLGGR